MSLHNIKNLTKLVLIIFRCIVTNQRIQTLYFTCEFFLLSFLKEANKAFYKFFYTITILIYYDFSVLYFNKIAVLFTKIQISLNFSQLITKNRQKIQIFYCIVPQNPYRAVHHCYNISVPTAPFSSGSRQPCITPYWTGTRTKHVTVIISQQQYDNVPIAIIKLKLFQTNYRQIRTFPSQHPVWQAKVHRTQYYVIEFVCTVAVT